MSLSRDEQKKLNKQLVDELNYVCYWRYSNETALEILTDLLNKGAVLEYGSIPMELLIAVVLRDIVLLKLFDMHVNLQVLRSHNGNSLLHYATSRGNMDMVEYLLERGFEMELKNDEGQTPFLLTFHIAIIKYLLRRGANPFVKDKNGKGFDTYYNNFRNGHSIRGDRIKAKYALLRFLKLTLETQLGEVKTLETEFVTYSRINQECSDIISPFQCNMMKAHAEYTNLLLQKTEGPSESHAILLYNTIQTVEKELATWKAVSLNN